MPNVYYSPEEFGLEIVGVADDPDVCYEFSTFVVWQDKAGQLYFADDSGCSCPCPFEDLGTIEDLGAPASVQEIHKALSEWSGSDSSKINAAAELHRTLMTFENTRGGVPDDAAAIGSAAA